MDIDTDHKKFYASVPVKPMAPRRLRQADEQWTTENSRPKQKYHQRKPIAIKLNEQKILYKLSQPHGDSNHICSEDIPRNITNMYCAGETTAIVNQWHYDLQRQIMFPGSFLFKPKNWS